MTPDVEAHCADDGRLRFSTIRISGCTARFSPAATDLPVALSANDSTAPSAAVPCRAMSNITCLCDQHHRIAHSAPDFAYCDCRKHASRRRRAQSPCRSDGP